MDDLFQSWSQCWPPHTQAQLRQSQTVDNFVAPNRQPRHSQRPHQIFTGTEVSVKWPRNQHSSKIQDAEEHYPISSTSDIAEGISQWVSHPIRVNSTLWGKHPHSLLWQAEGATSPQMNQKQSKLNYNRKTHITHTRDILEHLVQVTRKTATQP